MGIILGLMRIDALTAILDPVFGYGVATAAIDYGIKRTVAEETIELPRLYPLVAGKIAALFIAEITIAVFWH